MRMAHYGAMRCSVLRLLPIASLEPSMDGIACLTQIGYDNVRYGMPHLVAGKNG